MTFTAPPCHHLPVCHTADPSTGSPAQKKYLSLPSAQSLRMRFREIQSLHLRLTQSSHITAHLPVVRACCSLTALTAGGGMRQQIWPGLNVGRGSVPGLRLSAC